MSIIEENSNVVKNRRVQVPRGLDMLVGPAMIDLM